MTIGDGIAIGSIAFAICFFNCCKLYTNYKRAKEKLEEEAMTNPVAEIVNVVEKRDSLGRRNNGWTNAGPGRKRLYGAALTEFYNLRLDKETMELLKARAKRDDKTIADKLRDYIEWGLENEE